MLNRKLQQISILGFSALIGAACQPSHTTKPSDKGTPKAKPNVLFIMVDDLRPELGCYGAKLAQTPFIDSLASIGVLLDSAYCSVPVCGASRASLLTGLHPTQHRFLQYYTRADEDAPQVTTLPQHFKNNGYFTASLGKIFHHADDSPQSWTRQNYWPKNYVHQKYFPDSTFELWRDYLKKENVMECVNTPNRRGPAWECYDTTDNGYKDGRIAQAAELLLDSLVGSNSKKPFFLAVGFLKPHLPFNAPQKYWDLYKETDFSLPGNYEWPSGFPIHAMHNSGELRHYSNIPAFEDQAILPDTTALQLIKGYYASMSYADAQVGRVLRKLKQVGLDTNTIIVLMGDHGWNLGEHTLWCKHTLLNTATQTAAMVVAPSLPKNKKAKFAFSFADWYPTLCNLTSLEPPSHLQGQNMVSWLQNPDTAARRAVYIRHWAGDAIFNGQSYYAEYLQDQKKHPQAMLFDHLTDPNQNHNLVLEPNYKELASKMHNHLKTLKQNIAQ